MRGRIWTVAAGLASVAALIAVPSALAAYTTPKLEVRQVGTATTFKTTQSSADDATFILRIFVPGGTTVTATQAACLQGAPPLATWVLALSIAGTAVNVPLYLVATSGALAALGPAYIQTCVASPYIPASAGGAANGAQLVNAEFTAQGVFSPVAVGAFVAIWIPWTVGTGTPNLAGTIATPAAIAPGAVTAAAKKLGLGALVTGRVTQAGQPRGGATVSILGGAKATGLKRLGRVKVNANGAYTFRAKSGTFFKATAVATSASAGPLCTQLGPALAPVPCANPTVNGFTASSK